MSFLRHDENIKYGDTLVVYLSYNNLLQFEVERGKINQTKYGALKHDDLVGQKYGSKRQLSKGYVFLLPVSPELWTVSLKHRTQILYATDISFIIYQLDLRPGSVVIESGSFQKFVFLANNHDTLERFKYLNVLVTKNIRLSQK